VPRVGFTHVDDPKSVGRRLKEARQRAGLTQRDLSFPGCTSAYISRIEAGARTPSLQLIHEFARMLRVSPEYLASGVDTTDRAGDLVEAEVALRLGDLDHAAELYESRLNADDADRNALAGLGEIALRAGRFDDAIGYLERAVDAPDEGLVGDPRPVENLARAYAFAGALENAIALLERAAEDAAQRQALVETFRFNVLLANALIDSGEFQKAEVVLARTLKTCQELRDPLATARVFWSQSRLHTHNDDPELGARYARKALAILERAENESYVAMAYHLLAYAEIEAGNAEAALEQLERGREHFGPNLTPRDEAKFSMEETRALLQLGQTSDAANKAAVALGKIELLDAQDRGRAYLLLGDVFRASGDDERAVELLELAVEILEKDGKPYVVEAASRLADLLEEKGRPEEALAVLKRAVSHGRSHLRA
jgi:tetratricopeptide (TPR) repeat protein